VRKLITKNTDWVNLVNHLNQQKIVAFDLEANGMHAYPEHICLLQFGTDNDQFIVYPEAIESPKLLCDFFNNDEVEKIFHSCDYDIRSLHRDYGVSVSNMFDTAVAAQFLGAKQLGLANVINKFLNVEIEKSKKFQKMDWGKRPLPDEALNYAADDVIHLIKLRNILVKKLKKLNRLDWVKEEIARLSTVRFKNNNSKNEAYLKIKGIRALKPRQLAILKELCIFREKIAVRKNMPPFKVVSNKLLISIAKKPDVDLNSMKGIGKWLLNNHKDLFVKAINKGIAAEPVFLDALPKKPSWNNGSNARLTALKKWRLGKGEELSLDPAVIWPTSSLQNIARKPDCFEKEINKNSDIRNWQKNVFSNELKNFIEKY